MAQPANNPAARLRLIEAAKVRAKPLRRGELLASKPMAELLRVNWQTLRRWCDEIPRLAESDAFVRGGNGIEWEFKPKATIALLSAHFKAVQTEGRKQVKRIREIAAGDELAGTDQDLDLDQLTKMVRLNREIQELRVREGRLVDADEQRSAVRAMFGRMQDAVLRSAQEQDPTGQWPPEIRESFENATQSILLAMEQAGQECLASLNGGSA